MSPRVSRLFAQTTPIVVALILALLLFRIATDFGSVTVLNGVLNLRPHGLLESIAGAIVWTLAVTVGIAALEGRDRPLHRALRALPVAMTALLLIAVLFAVAFTVTGLAAISTAVAGLIVGIALAVAIAGLMARLALVPAVAVLEDRRGLDAMRRASMLAKGNLPGLAVVFAAGVLLPAWLSAMVFGALRAQADGWVVLALNLAQDLVLVALAASQAMVLANRYLARTQSQAPQGETLYPGLVRLGLGSLAALLVISAFPTFVLGILAVSGFPTVVTRPLPPSTVLATAWPQNRGPVVVTSDGIHDCLDNTCTATDATPFAHAFYGISGGDVTVAPDGSVYALTQGSLEYCDLRRVCYRTGQEAPWLGFGVAAITLSPYNEIVIARAISVADPAEPGKAIQTELSIVRCRDIHCREPRITTLGRVQAVLDRSGFQVGDRAIAVTTGRFGRPIVAFTPTPDSPLVYFGWCDTMECAVPGLGQDGPSAPADMPSAAERSAFPLRSTCWHADSCERFARLGQSSERDYQVTSEFFQRDGWSFYVGARSEQPRRLVLLDCPDRECASPARTIPLMELTWDVRRWAVSAHPDGRLVVATSTKIILVKP